MQTSHAVSFTAHLTPLDGPMVHHAIPVPEEVAAQFRQPKGAVRILCSVEGQEEFPCALNPRGEGYVIIASKALIRKHKLHMDVPFHVSIRKDLNDGLLMPEELVEVLDQDEWAAGLFEKLLPGHKRGLFYYIRSAKTIDTRIKRSFEIVEKLKTGTLHVQNQKRDDESAG
ncbi:MAG TPA: YdeI/OmpD-associated family protein [Sphingobacteriaceae bacterium]